MREWRWSSDTPDGLQAYRHTLRQTRPRLFLYTVPRCRHRVLAVAN
jgi:hypothetical protein